MTSRNQVMLDSFTEYCKANPEQRFFQALCNWSGWRAILVCTKIKNSNFVYEGIQDTWHWETLRECPRQMTEINGVSVWKEELDEIITNQYTENST